MSERGEYTYDYPRPMVTVDLVILRGTGGDLEVLRAVREAPEAQRQQWPRIVAAGRVLDGPEPVDPSISFAVGDAPQAIAAVDALAAAGADFV